MVAGAKVNFKIGVFYMKVLALIAVICTVALTGCKAGQPLERVGTKFYGLHEEVFGCPPLAPEKYVPPVKSLDAVGPAEECPLVYKRPACSERE